MLLSEKIQSAIRDVADYPKPGIVFKDITPLLAQPLLMREVVDCFVAKLKPMKLDAIASVEARGFIFGSILAHELNCRFIPVRKAGKLPYKTIRQEYALEYGKAEMEMHEDAVQRGWNVLVHDDVLATGGTAAAAAELIRRSGGEIAGFSFLINLSFLAGDKRLAERFGVRLDSLVTY